MYNISAKDVELLEPYAIFDGLADIAQLESLREDIDSLLSLGANAQFWNALMLLCDDELQVGWVYLLNIQPMKDYIFVLFL